MSHMSLKEYRAKRDFARSPEPRGDERLAISVRQIQFTFKPVQVPGLLYGRDYFLGDLVTAVYDGVSYARRVQSVGITVDESGSWVDVRTVDA